MKRLFLSLSLAAFLLLGTVVADEPCPTPDQNGKCVLCSNPPGPNGCSPDNDQITVADGSPCCVPKPPQSNNAQANANANAQGGGNAQANAQATANGNGSASASASANSNGQPAPQ